MKEDSRKHSLPKSILLHLLPGILIGGFYFVAAPFIREQGFPSVMALTLAGIFVLLPFELGFLLYKKRLTGKKLMGGVIKYTKRISIWQYIVWVLVIFILSGIIFTALKSTSDYFMTFFNWIPSDMTLDMGLSKEFSKQKLIITYGSSFVFFVILFPAVEEMYFRGYLLPRMPANLKGWTSVIHSGLFALYHVWSPWFFVARTFGLLPLVYIVKRKENVFLGIIAHSLLNSIDFIVGAVFILNY